jgi:hypothetical protein
MWQACPSPAGAGAAGGDCVATDAAGGEQGNTELAWAQMEGARAEEGRLGLLAAGRGAGRRARRREWQLVVVVVAAAAMVAMVGAVLAVVVAVVAAERQRRPRGGRGDRRRPRSLRWRQSSVAARCQSSVAAAFYQ